MQKIAIDAGFSCPNRNPGRSGGGCTFCDNNAFNPSYCNPDKSVSQQISKGIEFHRKRYRRAVNYLAYFQAYSNTNAPVERLDMMYREALRMPGVKGLIIGTRPDCVNGEILDLISELSGKYYIIVEYGIESCYNRTLERINRGHTYEATVKAFRDTAARNILCGGHLIIGLPGESREEILAEASIISDLPIHSLKFHQLQIIKGTAMEQEYNTCPERFQMFSMEEYLSFLVEFIENMNPQILIERIAGEVPPAYSVSPAWDLRYDSVLRQFEVLLEQRDSWQGKNYIA